MTPTTFNNGVSLCVSLDIWGQTHRPSRAEYETGLPISSGDSQKSHDHKTFETIAF